jgi:hypothetical protein
VGFHQLVTTLPASSPAGTRPDATPPTTAPRKKGVMTDESANVAPNNRCAGNVVDALRNANAPPRRMIPIAAPVSGR